MKRDINFYFVCVLAVAIMSVIGSVRFGPDWTDIGTWIVAVIAIFIMAVKFFKSSDVETIPEKQDRGPLERASDRKH